MLYFIVIKDPQNIIPDYPNMLITYEEGKFKNNPHYHILLDSHLSIPTLRAQLQKQFKNKKQVSIKVCRDNHKSTLYILKDDQIIQNTLYTDEELATLQEQVLKIQEDIKNNKSKYTEYLVNKYIPIDEKQHRYLELNDHVLDFVLDNYTLDKKGFDIIIIRRVVNCIMSNNYTHFKTNFKQSYYTKKELKHIKKVRPIHTTTDPILQKILNNFN